MLLPKGDRRTMSPLYVKNSNLYLDKRLEKLYDKFEIGRPQKYYVKDVTIMKKLITKVSAIAMAALLLGTGTALTKTISPKSDNVLTAHAKFCSGSHDYHYSYSYSFKQNGTVYCYDVYVCSRCGTRNPRLVARY